MDQATSALLGAFIGASAGIGGGVALEVYRRYRDMKGTASALAGEIASILHMADVRKHVENFERILQRLDAGKNVPIPRFAPGPDYRDPVGDRFLDKLGLLPGDLPEKVVRFYAVVSGIRIDINQLIDDNCSLEAKKVLIRENLPLWRANVRLGNELTEELRRVGQQTWWRSLRSCITNVTHRLGARRYLP